MIFTLVAMLTMAVSANAMSYERARNEALFLTDKMAYELNLTDAQYEAAYEINLDYLMSVTDYRDVDGIYWQRRNADLQFILYSWQWDLFRAATYFFRPLRWVDGLWHFGIYVRYPHRDYFYFGRPHFYATYRGGHSWRMNGGHSYYEGHRDHFRPGHVERDHHIGMRSGWDRGDYRNVQGRSSTHITGPDRHHDNHGYRNNDNRGYRNNDNRDYRNNDGYGVGSNRNNGGNSHFDGNRGGNGNSNSNRNVGGGNSNNSRNNGGSSHFGGSRSGGSSSGHSGGGATRSSGSSRDRSSSSRR
jgi:hypothetical protein